MNLFLECPLALPAPSSLEPSSVNPSQTLRPLPLLRRISQAWELQEAQQQIAEQKEAQEAMAREVERNRKAVERSEEEARTELFEMPLTIETMALTKKKNALEAKLKEIEDAKKIFSRPKVFIAQD